jgi:AraC-like DNA-binding protein
MSLPHGYRETLHDRFAAEAAWQFFAETAGEHRVLPDGRCDIILRFRSDGLKPLGVITAIVVGAATRFHSVTMAAGTGYVGARLRPGAARAVLGMDLRAITDRGLVGDAALAKVPALDSLCGPASSVDGLVDRLDRFVAERSVTLTIDPLTAALIDSLHVTGGRLSVADIAALHGVDVRTVRRRICSATGLTPKQFAMVVQFHRALRLRFHDGLDVASTAFEAGYADQAHMSRVFRLMGGISPARRPDLVLAGLPIEGMSDLFTTSLSGAHKLRASHHKDRS